MQLYRRHRPFAGGPTHGQVRLSHFSQGFVSPPGTQSPELLFPGFRAAASGQGEAGTLEMVCTLTKGPHAWRGAPCLYLFWETVAGLLEAGQVVRCLGAMRKRQRDRGSLRKELGRNGGEPRLLQVISGPAERGLAPACLGGPEQKEPPGPGQ